MQHLHVLPCCVAFSMVCAGVQAHDQIRPESADTDAQTVSDFVLKELEMAQNLRCAQLHLALGIRGAQWF